MGPSRIDLLLHDMITRNQQKTLNQKPFVKVVLEKSKSI